MSPHLKNCFDPLTIPGIIANLERRITQSEIEFDAIACTGISGMAIAPIVANNLRKHLLVVRKIRAAHSIEVIRSHPDFMIECACPFLGRYIIIDDLIDSGDTIETIHNEIKKCYPAVQVVGIFTYDDIVILDTKSDLGARFSEPIFVSRVRSARW